MKKWMSWLLVGVFFLIFPNIASAKLSQGDFVDVHGHWAEQDIQTTVDLGLMQGMGTNQQGFKVFSPDGNVTRAQLSAVLQRTFDLDYGNVRFIEEPGVCDYYYDVEEDAWYAEAAILSALNNLFDSGKCFQGDDVVTRMEVAQSVNRAFNVKNICVPMIMLMPYFEDTEGLGSEEKNAIVFVNNTGIMQGYNNMFRPQDPVKRSELAKILNQCHQIIEKNHSQEIMNPSTVQLEINKTEMQSDVIDVELNTPVIKALNNEDLKTKINEQLESDASKLVNSIKEIAMEDKKSAEQQGFPFHSYAVATNCSSYYVDDEILSFYVDYYTYTGGAHGITDRVAYNYNLKTGEELAIKDFFAKDVNYTTLIDKAIRQEINTHPDDFFSGESGFNGISAEQAFYVQNGSLVVYFQQYEIACYAAGIQEFNIPIPAK